MTLPLPIQTTLLRYQAEIQAALRRAVESMKARREDEAAANDLRSFYGQIAYHLGWVDADFAPIAVNAGKLLRPALALLAYEAAGAWGLDTTDNQHLSRALPAAAAIELTHNFTLIHDDIEDGDSERHHRPTVWKQWGIPQAINTGDGLFALSRLTLWGVLEEGVDGLIAARLGEELDRACLTIAEGQFLDLSFERQQDVSVMQYIDMIERKTAALMAGAAAMGALLGTHDRETIERLRNFGHAIGIAFQVRDDLLGVWASTAQSGKTEAGDIYRRKKSLPLLHALEHANAEDQRYLREVYHQETPVSSEQVKHVLTIFARTETRAYCRAFLVEQCRFAHAALASVPHTSTAVSTRALQDMEMLVRFVQEQ
ncbi:MAG: polyprenyl synthetase family protein [Ktedonobacteraceae bacterium]